MVFAETMDKKKIPLDIRAPVYRVVTEDADGTPLIVERAIASFVTHFATCPKASDFSGGKAKP
jgi:hypothetical protein